MGKSAFWGLALVTAVALTPLPATAFDPIYDFEAMTCGEMLKLPRNEMALVITWINGFNAGRTDRTVFVSRQADREVDGFLDYCKRHKQATVMRAYQESFQR